MKVLTSGATALGLVSAQTPWARRLRGDLNVKQTLTTETQSTC